MKNKIKPNLKTILVFLFICLSIVLTVSSFRKPKVYKTKAASCEGCGEGSCDTVGAFCLNKIDCRCEGNIEWFDVWECKNEEGNNHWVRVYQQCGATGNDCMGTCGGPTVPFPTPTSSGCTCEGGFYSVQFYASRELVNGEQINCGIDGGTCHNHCGTGQPCDNATNHGLCSIHPGSNFCGIGNLDCTCTPYDWSCHYYVNGQEQDAWWGQYGDGVPKNGGNNRENLGLPQVPTATPPQEETPRPTRTPSPTPSSTPVPTIPGTTPSPTPTRTPTPTPSRTPTPTRTPTPSATATPWPTNLPSPTPSNTPTPTNTPTLTPTNTPTPTEIVIVQTTSTPTTIAARVTEIPSAGVPVYIQVFSIISFSVLLLGLLF